MAQLPVTFSNPKGQFSCLKPFYRTHFGKYCVYYLRCVYK